MVVDAAFPRIGVCPDVGFAVSTKRSNVVGATLGRSTWQFTCPGADPSLSFFSSAAEERIVEVESKEEFESCKVGNPIRMYTEGLSTVSLENEGSRYFISSRVESCQNGLKLHVNVQPQSKAVREIKGDDAVNRGVAAEGPKPSSHFHQGSPL